MSQPQQLQQAIAINESSTINEKNKEILASLAVQADVDEDKTVRDCIRAYKLDAHEKTLQATFTKFTKDNIIRTLKFLNVEGTLERYLKPKLVNELICRIQNLLIEKCDICKKHFATALSDKLLLPCKLCGQNMHIECLKTLLGEKYHDDITNDEVMNILNPFKVENLHYLCSTCTASTLPSEDDGICKRIGRVAAAIETSNDNTNLDSSLLQQPSLERIQSNDVPWRNRNDVCELFLQDKCQFGITGKGCGKYHPKICAHFRKNGRHNKYGCNKEDSECIDFHPKMCPSSLKNRTCFDHSCQVKHGIFHAPLDTTQTINNTRQAIAKIDHRIIILVNHIKKMDPLDIIVDIKTLAAAKETTITATDGNKIMSTVNRIPIIIIILLFLTIALMKVMTPVELIFVGGGMASLKKVTVLQEGA